MQVPYDPGGIRLIDPWESLSEIHSIKGTRESCKLSLTQCLYDPGTLPSSANQCVLGNVYVRTNMSRKQIVFVAARYLTARRV